MRVCLPLKISSTVFLKRITAEMTEITSYSRKKFSIIVPSIKAVFLLRINTTKRLIINAFWIVLPTARLVLLPVAGKWRT